MLLFRSELVLIKSHRASAQTLGLRCLRWHRIRTELFGLHSKCGFSVSVLTDGRLHFIEISLAFLAFDAARWIDGPSLNSADPVKPLARGDQDVETLDEVKRIIARSLRVPIEQLTDDTRLEDLGAESLDIIEIVYDIEEKFGIDVTIKPGESSLLLQSETPGTESMTKLATVAEIARVVESLVNAKSGQ